VLASAVGLCTVETIHVVEDKGTSLNPREVLFSSFFLFLLLRSGKQIIIEGEGVSNDGFARFQGGKRNS